MLFSDPSPFASALSPSPSSFSSSKTCVPDDLILDAEDPCGASFLSGLLTPKLVDTDWDNMANTALSVLGDADSMQGSMDMPTLDWSSSFTDPLYPLASPDSFDGESSKRRKRQGSDDSDHHFSNGVDSLSDGLLSQPLHDGINFQDNSNIMRVENAPTVTNSTNALGDSAVVPIRESHLQAYNKIKSEANGASTNSSSDVSFTPSVTRPTPEPALPAEEWGSGELSGLGPVTSTSNNEFNSRQRSEDDDNNSATGSPGVKRKRDSAGVQIAIPSNISEDQKLLLELRDEQNLPWKDIALKFQNELGRSDRVPALQMRYKRLKERLRVWTDTDVEALRQAYQYWETRRFEIVSEKMLEFGVSEKWPARHCALKWQEISANTEQRPHLDAEYNPFNLPSQNAGPGGYMSGIGRSSSFSTFPHSRADFVSGMHTPSSMPGSARLSAATFSPGIKHSLFHGGMPSSPGLASYMGPRRMHSNSLDSNHMPTLSRHSSDILSQPLYSSHSPFSLPSTSASSQAGMTELAYAHTPPHHHSSLSHSSSYSHSMPRY